MDRRTRDIDVVSMTWQIDAYRFDLPLVAQPSDATMLAKAIIETLAEPKPPCPGAAPDESNLRAVLDLYRELLGGNRGSNH